MPNGTKKKIMLAISTNKLCLTAQPEKVKDKLVYFSFTTYDHYVRKDGEFERIQQYIIMNPVKAKIVDQWEDYKWTYTQK